MDHANEPHEGDGPEPMPVAAEVDAEPFRTLFDRHLDPVWRFARRRCSSAADADDIAAETFAVAWRRRADLPPVDEIGLWLFGVARRVLANHRRTIDRQDLLHRKLASVAPTELAGDPGTDGDDRAEGLALALAALDDDDRDLLIMRAWDGLAVQDIAVLLGCTPNAASIRLHRARGRLAHALEGGSTGDLPPPRSKEPTSSRTSAGRPTPREEDRP